MIRLSIPDKEQPLQALGPHVFLAPMVQDDGVLILREILEFTQDLEDTCLHKWRTRARVAEFLRLLIDKDDENPLLRSLQQHIRDLVMDGSFSKLLCRLPPATCIEDSQTSSDLH